MKFQTIQQKMANNLKKDIPGYRFIETKKLPNGDTVHVYEKIIPSVEPEPANPQNQLRNCLILVQKITLA